MVDLALRGGGGTLALSASSTTLRLAPNTGSAALGLVVGTGPAGPPGPAGVGGSDAGFAGYLGDTASATYAAMLNTSSAVVARALGWAVVTDKKYAGGAKLDGVTDDAAAFQAALNSRQGRGGTVFVPGPESPTAAATYALIGTPLTVWPRTRLQGSSSLAARLQAKAGIGGPVLKCCATDGSDPNWHWGEVSNLYIDGNKAAQTLPSSVTPTAVANSTGQTVTVTKTAHGLKVGDCIEFSGFTPDAFNGTFFVFAVADADHFSVQGSGAAGTVTVFGTYRKLLNGINLPQAGETSWFHNVVVNNCFDHGIVQGYVGTPMRYSGMSLNGNGRDGLALWTDRPVSIDGLSGDGNGSCLLRCAGKVSVGGNAVGSVTVLGIKYENSNVPAVILDDYPQAVTLIGGGITMGTGNAAACIQRTSKSQVSSLNVIGVVCTPQWGGAGNIFLDSSTSALSVNTLNSSATAATFFVGSTNSVLGAVKFTSRKQTLGDTATVAGINVTAADYFQLTCTVAVGAARTISAPVGTPVGQPSAQRITICIYNNTGGAITTTWNAAYGLAGPWVDPANGKKRLIHFIFDNALGWLEDGRSAADI